jgi:hypothetical protein
MLNLLVFHEISINNLEVGESVSIENRLGGNSTNCKHSKTSIQKFCLTLLIKCILGRRSKPLQSKVYPIKKTRYRKISKWQLQFKLKFNQKEPQWPIQRTAVHNSHEDEYKNKHHSPPGSRSPFPIA